MALLFFKKSNMHELTKFQRDILWIKIKKDREILSA